MPSILISYRRDDTQAFAGRIFDHLERHFGPGHVLMDIDNIPLGHDFREHLRHLLDKSDILLALVGKDWLGKTSTGAVRIHDETDWVRIEVETALKRNIPVIPVLVGATQMPKPEELPVTLQDFAFRQAINVDPGQDFRTHVARLINSMERTIQARADAARLREERSSLEKAEADKAAGEIAAAKKAASEKAAVEKAIADKVAAKKASADRIAAEKAAKAAAAKAEQDSIAKVAADKLKEPKISGWQILLGFLLFITICYRAYGYFWPSTPANPPVKTEQKSTPPVGDQKRPERYAPVQY